jgi:hypothetical protein
MNLSAAAAKAARYAGNIHARSSTQYTRYAPWRLSQYKGPTTEVSHATYSAARVARAADVAEIALHLLERWTLERAAHIEHMAQDPYGDHTARGMLRAALAIAD